MFSAFLHRAAAAWVSGAATIFGPLSILVLLFITLFGAVGVLQLALSFAPWGWETVAWAGPATLLLGPWLVARGWNERHGVS